jgi:hypothetical protein
MVYNYGSVAVVQEIISASSGETTITDRLARVLTQAEALIDIILEPWADTLPITPAPQVLVDVANDWAAGILYDEITLATMPNPPPNPFLTRAKDNLDSYMIANGWTPPADDGSGSTTRTPMETIPIGVTRWGDYSYTY